MLTFHEKAPSKIFDKVPKTSLIIISGPFHIFLGFEKVLRNYLAILIKETPVRGLPFFNSTLFKAPTFLKLERFS